MTGRRTVSLKYYPLAALAWTALAAEAATPAGSTIENTGFVQYSIAGHTKSASSNISRIFVDELVRIAISPEVARVGGLAANAPVVVAFNILNDGNGVQSVSLTSLATGSGQFAILPESIHTDTDGDGVYSPLNDLPFGAQDSLELSPGQTLKLFVVGRVGDGFDPGAEGEVSLLAQTDPALVSNQSGSGAGGGDVVLASADGSYRGDAVVVQSAVRLSFAKSAKSDGPSTYQAAPGDSVTYTLVVDATGSGLVKQAVIADDLPDGVAYIANSLSLDGAALSDLNDADAGSHADGRVEILLSEQNAPFSHEVTFRARVIDPPGTNGDAK